MRTSRRLYSILLFLVAMALTGAPQATAQAPTPSFETLTQGASVRGFRAEAVYVDEADQPMGARFIHERTGFTFDVLRIQSAPQAFIWVNSFPVSDMGEPHTQEHLLLGKGNRGRSLAELEQMSLSNSSAFTQQWRTCYNFHTAAGPDAYYQLFETHLDALLHPDYTDEEIRREVRNFGVSRNSSDETLRLEEKGTVYNEMVSSFERSWSRMGHAMDTLTYGPRHPLSYVSGGLPAAIRRMKAEDIRAFHRNNYHLGNMGMVGAFPKEMMLDDILRRTGEILDRLQPESETRGRHSTTKDDLPAPHPATTGSIRIAYYPQANENQPGPIMFAWSPTLKLDVRDRLVLGLFLGNVAGDATTNLYKRFIDSKTRTMDIGATGVGAWVSSDQGNPVYFSFSNVATDQMTEERIGAIRTKVIEELKHIASLPDGSPELIEFNRRLLNRVTETRRDLSRFVNSPPGFGFRGTGSGWMEQLDAIAGSHAFRRSVTQKEDLAFVEGLANDSKNVWREYLKKWRLLDELPYAVAAKPSADLVHREADERQARIADEVARLKKMFGVKNDQEAIRRYAQQYDSATARIEALAQSAAPARFVDNPPLTLDDQLDYRATTVGAHVPMIVSTFDNMTSAEVGIALNVDGVRDDELVYLSALPSLLTDVGVIENGRPVSYEEMSERLRTELYELVAYYSANYRTGRCELVVRGAGNDTSESKRAVAWMKLVLTHPDWRVENLPRIRDVIDQTLSGLRNTMQGSEESWVRNPAAAYLRQDDAVLLSANSFLTRTHNIQRLRWLLKDAGSQSDAAAISGFLTSLATAGDSGRANAQGLLAALKGDSAATQHLSLVLKQNVGAYAALSPAAKSIALDAVKDLELTIPLLPDESFASDWKYLCYEMRHDLLVPPAQTLTELNNLRTKLLRTLTARMFMIGSKSGQRALGGSIDTLAALLDNVVASMPARASQSEGGLIRRRLRERMPDAKAPIFVGLVNPSTGSGVFLNSAPLASYSDTDRSSILDFLAAQLYGGHGAHGVFTRTISAGLAYSNGIGAWPGNGRVNYYAERCPELPQTLRFVIDELKKAKPDPKLAEYAIAGAFGSGRVASSYESRGESIASDIADGETPDVVARFNRALLALRSMPNLAAELFRRMPSVYAKVLPGYGGRMKDVTGGVFMVIGPEKQMSLYEEYLKSVEGADAKLYRLYPRDFWMTVDVKPKTAIDEAPQ